MKTLLSVPLLALVCTLALAQDVASGPEQGKPLPPLKVFAVTGAQQGKEVDYAAERQGKPTVYCLLPADQLDRPLGRFLKTLDEALVKDDPAARIVAVWLTDNLDQTRTYLPQFQQSFQLQATALTCFGDKAGPADWGINPDARLTVVVVREHKVVTTFGYRSVNETDVPPVREALKKGPK